MFKKVSLIIFLALLLAGGLVFRHFWLRTTDEPSVIDRLPDGDYLVRAKLLDLAQETTGMLHFNKVKFRDFASKEFLLGQAKIYGLDLQRPVYSFVNENGSWGSMLYVSDSSEINAGIQRLRKVIEIRDTLIDKQKAFCWDEENGYLSYGKNWLFLYKGGQFSTKLREILYAKKDSVSAVWSDFLKDEHFNQKSLVIYSNSRGIQKYGIEKAMFAHNVDSTSITLLSYVKSIKPFNFVPKQEGLAMEKAPGSKKFLNLHMNIENFRSASDDPLYRLLDRKSKRINFPLEDFLQVWNGDLSFGEGGSQIIKETYIESVLDENFEITEVVSVKERKVNGFSIALSMNEGAKAFINQLLRKGILTREEEKYRFLISPPLTMKKQGEYYLFYSGQKSPILKPNSQTSGFLSYKRTPFTFYLDTIIGNEAFGKIDFPVDRVIRRNKFF